MKKLDRIVERPQTDASPAHWFFKTSEGLMGPFDSFEAAKAMLENFVARCKANGLAEIAERS